MATVVTIGGSPADVPRTVVPLRLVPLVKGGVASFAFAVRGVKLAALPDPHLGKSVSVTVNSTLRFTGQVAGRHPSYVNGLGYCMSYQSIDLFSLADWVPHTDANNGLDQSTYNTSRDNGGFDYLAARAGRSTGQILTDVLQNVPNATGLNSFGVGNYTGLPSAPVLPAATVADLATLTFVPPGPVSFGGEHLLSGVNAFLMQWCPWTVLRVKPDGTIRFLDLRSFTPHTLTVGTDPIDPPIVSRDTSLSASRVLVRGSQLAEMFLFSLSNGGLSEAPFAHDGLTVAQAKAAWVPGDYRSPGLVVGSVGDDDGTCTCPSTTTVTVTSAHPLVNWPSNYWDQTSTGREGQIYLSYSAGTTITTYAMREVVSNTALAAGGTSTLTLDRALPHLLFDHYVIAGLTKGASAVYVVYQLPSWAATKVAPQSFVPAPYRASSTAGVALTSTALGTVLWSSSGSPPYESATTGVVVDPITGYVHFGNATRLIAGREPADVRAMVPIFVGVNQVASPQDVAGVPQYAGQLHTLEAVDRTLTVTVPAWRDPANAAAMQTWADQLLTSVQDPAEEGEVVYHGLYEPALEMGIALNFAGNGYTTGWEASALPVVEVQLEWGTGPGSATDHTTTIRFSSRKNHFSAEAFLKPARTGVTFDWSNETSLDWSGPGRVPNFGGMVGAVGVADLPSAAGALPNPGALVDFSGGNAPNPASNVPNPAPAANPGLDEAADRARARLDKQVRGERVDD